MLKTNFKLLEKKLKDFGFDELEIGNVYNGWIFSVIKPYISKRILEIGCGLGTTTKYYLHSPFIVISDINDLYLRLVRKKFEGIKNIKITKLNIEDAPPKKLKILKKYKIDTVIAINVLEHINNDLLALKNINRILFPGGRVVLFIPALPSIYGSLDKKFGHYRRYTKGEIYNKLRMAHFKIEYTRYFNIIGLFWWFVTGRILKKNHLPRMTGRLLSIIVPILQKVESLIRIPTGQSLIVVGVKKDNIR